MTDLTEKKIYSVIDVKDELPKIEGSYPVKYKSNNYFSSAYFNKKRFEISEVSKITHWLREEENKIVLTKEELIELIDDAMTAGKIWGEIYQGWFTPTTDQHKDKFEEFLTSKGLSLNKNKEV